MAPSCRPLAGTFLVYVFHQGRFWCNFDCATVTGHREILAAVWFKNHVVMTQENEVLVEPIVIPPVCPSTKTSHFHRYGTKFR